MTTRKRAATSLKEEGQEGQHRRRPFNTKLDADIVLKAQIRCLREGVFMNHIIEQLLAAWLADKVKVTDAGARKRENGN